MPAKKNKAVKKIDVFEKEFKVLKGKEEVVYVSVEEVDPKGPKEEELKEGAESNSGYFCCEFFQKKKKS